MKQIDRAKGFTFIELIIVIVLVAILAVIGLPKMLESIDKAKESSLQTVANNFSTAVISAMGQWQLDGKPRDKNGENLVYYGGNTFRLTKSDRANQVMEGFPIGLSYSRTKTIADMGSIDCAELFDNLLYNAPRITALRTDALTGKYSYFAEWDPASVECSYYAVNKDARNAAGVLDIRAGSSFTYSPKNAKIRVELSSERE